MALVKTDDEIMDEMSIVDLLTKLIFDAESELDDTELVIIGLLGQVEHSLLDASRRDISEYLRAMGVDEMIRMVGQLKRCFDHQQSVIAVNNSNNRQSAHRCD